MERLVDYKYSELISAGFDRLSEGMTNRLRYAHFLTGTSPIRSGLKRDYGKTINGQSYHTTWFVSYPHNSALPKHLQRTTIVLPEYAPDNYPSLLLPMLIVHELGHVLDEILGWGHIAEPVTEYAKSNRQEAFAEAFTSWLNPGYEEYYDLIREVDEGTLNLFQELEKMWG